MLWSTRSQSDRCMLPKFHESAHKPDITPLHFLRNPTTLTAVGRLFLNSDHGHAEITIMIRISDLGASESAEEPHEVLRLAD